MKRGKILKGLSLIVIIGIVVAVIVVLMESKSSAQEENNLSTLVEEGTLPTAEKALEKVPELEEAIIINNGYVIAHGKYIDPPYTVLIKNGYVFINNIPYFPLKTKSTKRIETVKKITPLRKQQHEFIQQCGESYAKWIEEYGSEEAKEKVLELVNNSSLVKSYSMRDEVLIVNFHDGLSEHILLYTWRLSKPKRKKPEKMAEVKKKELLELLQKGMLIAFGKGYRIIIPKEEAFNFLNKLNNIMSLELEKEYKKELLLKIAPKKFADDIIFNW